MGSFQHRGSGCAIEASYRSLSFRASSAGAGKACLDQHNVYRALHRKSALQWDSNLARGAQEWANKLASMGSLQHSSGNYGENLAFAFDSRGVQNLGKEAVVRWYEEI